MRSPSYCSNTCMSVCIHVCLSVCVSVYHMYTDYMCIYFCYLGRWFVWCDSKLLPPPHQWNMKKDHKGPWKHTPVFTWQEDCPLRYQTRRYICKCIVSICVCAYMNTMCVLISISTFCIVCVFYLVYLFCMDFSKSQWLLQSKVGGFGIATICIMLSLYL